MRLNSRDTNDRRCSQLERTSQLKPSTKGAHKISEHRHLHAIAFECRAYFQKNSVVSSPLYPNHSRALALPVIIRTSGSYEGERYGGSEREEQTSGYACNDLAFDTRYDIAFLYHPS
jgi:hypothetical protein